MRPKKSVSNHLVCLTGSRTVSSCVPTTLTGSMPGARSPSVLLQSHSPTEGVMGRACPGAVRVWTAGPSPCCPLTERPCAPAVHWPWLSPGGSPSCENRSSGWEAGVDWGLCIGLLLPPACAHPPGSGSHLPGGVSWGPEPPEAAASKADLPSLDWGCPGAHPTDPEGR